MRIFPKRSGLLREKDMSFAEKGTSEKGEAEEGIGFVWSEEGGLFSFFSQRGLQIKCCNYLTIII